MKMLRSDNNFIKEEEYDEYGYENMIGGDDEMEFNGQNFDGGAANGFQMTEKQPLGLP